MADLTLPPPTMFGSRPIQPRPQPTQALQIYIQVPCQFAKYVGDQWETLATNALIQLVSQEEQTDSIKNVEYLRVLDIQDQPVFTHKLSELKWGQLAALAYELDTFHEGGALDKVFAVTFSSEQHVAQFNIKFDEAINLRSANADRVLPFLKPLTDAIERGDVNEAIKRFKFICQFPAEQRRFKIVAETPLTPEEIKQKNSVNINITIENYEGLEVDISLCVPKTASIGDLREIMYTIYEIPLEVQKWLGEQCLYKNSETVLDNTGEPKKIYLYILNAAKVGLNRHDFLAKLEAQRKNLRAKKETANQQRQQLQQQQPPPPPPQQLPTHEEEVQFPPGRESYYPHPPHDTDGGPPYSGANLTNTYEEVPPRYPPQIQSHGLSDSTDDEQPIKTIPGVVWACPKCKHINAWECMRCERCRIPKEEAM